MILIIEHIEVEGPGTIQDYFEKRGYDLKTIALYKGDEFPADLLDIEAVISMGGPMNVYDEAEFPFLKSEDVFIKKVLKEEVPFMGICLGSQLLAKASGAEVVKSPVKEVGWFKVDLSNEGKNDTVFKNVGGAFDVYHWHEDMWQLPKGAKLLATSPGCPHQAFKVGKNAYGLQFHIEVTGEIIKDWCDSYFKSNDPAKAKLAQEMVETYEKRKDGFYKQSDVIYENFEKLMMNGRGT